MKKIKRITSLILIFSIFITNISFALTNNKDTVEVLNNYELDEWGILALYSNANNVKDKTLEKITSTITTDYEAYIVGALPLGIDVSKEIKKVINSQNYRGKFADNIDGTGNELINAHIWGIISLYVAGEDNYDKEKALKWLKQNQNEDGGFAVFVNSDNSDIDMTAMAIVAYKILGLDENSIEVKKALNFIENNIDKKSTCESVAWYIMAKTMLGLEVEKSLYDKLLEYKLPDGGFKHLKTLNKSNYISTWHGLIAINDYERGISIFTRLHNATNFIKKNKNLLNTIQ
ncbi:prenyltransferase/squalene oxidase repeat-containing protein [Defluviitalea phaphyphila]|uniref:prenyltransferase/squalene oxidase repeat-containing protein n=1 Tax=Defluviitalea phaphyphila TaxID=1473580 RepID=UPI0007310F9B|nr:prenyltransferase/squalene oxidase repeat-containing protein [Defluviitalea phaphyphila]